MSNWFRNPFMPPQSQMAIPGSQPAIQGQGFTPPGYQSMPQGTPMAQNPGLGMFGSPQAPAAPPPAPAQPQGAPQGAPGPMTVGVTPSGFFGNHTASQSPPPPMPPPRPADLGGAPQMAQGGAQQLPGGMAQMPGSPMWVSNPMGGNNQLPSGAVLVDASGKPVDGSAPQDGTSKPGDGLNAFAKSGAMNSFKMADANSPVAGLMKLFGMGGLG